MPKNLLKLKSELIKVLKPEIENLDALDSAWVFIERLNRLTLPYKPTDMALEDFKTLTINIWKDL